MKSVFCSPSCLDKNQFHQYNGSICITFSTAILYPNELDEAKWLASNLNWWWISPWTQTPFGSLFVVYTGTASNQQWYHNGYSWCKSDGNGLLALASVDICERGPVLLWREEAKACTFRILHMDGFPQYLADLEWQTLVMMTVANTWPKAFLYNMEHLTFVP